jgi:chromosomal replication initiation ATPase DnaA
MGNSDKSIELISEVLKTASQIGLQKTLEVNIAARKDSLSVEEQAARKKVNNEFVINEVCKVFNITYNEFMNSRSRGIRKDACMVAMMYFKYDLKYTLEEIGAILKRDSSLVSKYITIYNKLDHKSRFDRKIIDKYATVIINIKNKID